MPQHISSALSLQRDHDFLKACRRVLADTDRTDLTVAEVARIAAESPAPSYYLSYDYARRMLTRHQQSRRNLPPSHRPLRRPRSKTTTEERRDEIAGKVEVLMERFPTLTPGEALARVLAGPASSFFLAPASARRLFTHLRRS